MATKRSLLFSSSTATMSIDTNTKRRRLYSSEYSFTQNPTPDWSQLQQELLELILSKLSFIQIIRFKAVCSSWNSIAQSFISSSIYNPLISQIPLLLLPASDQDDPDTNNTLCFFSMEDKKKYYIKNRGTNFGEDDYWCIGSSHGWLVILDKEANPFLLNPFSQARIQLPLTDSFMFEIEKYYFIKWLRKTYISKAVLLSDPSHDNNNYGTVVLIYGHYPSKLTFCKNGDSTWSTILDGASNNRSYCDIVFYNELLYALTFNNSIEIWDFHGSYPVKKKEINPSTSRKMVETIEYYRGSHSSQSYLVESCGDLLLVIRFMWDFVNQEVEAIDEMYLPIDKDTQPLVCPYRTKMFHVYKLHSKEQKWVEVENLKNHALFLGSNHSMSVSAQDFSGCEKNCIYFTDDNWKQMNEISLYGGHDLGKFSLEQKIVKPFCCLQNGEYRIFDPPSFWIIPNPR